MRNNKIICDNIFKQGSLTQLDNLDFFKDIFHPSLSPRWILFLVYVCHDTLIDLSFGLRSVSTNNPKLPKDVCTFYTREHS